MPYSKLRRIFGLVFKFSIEKITRAADRRHNMIRLLFVFFHRPVSPLNVIMLDVIPTVNVTQINAKCNTNRKCNKI